MIKHIKVNFFEFIVALLIFTFAAWQSYDTFLKLFPRISKGFSQTGPLTISNSFTLKLKTPHLPSAKNEIAADGDIPFTGSCIGTLESKFVRNLEGANFTLNGEVSLAVFNRTLPTKIDLEANFNVLGQLSAAIIRLTNMASGVTVGLLNVDPIELSVLSSFEGQKSDRKKFSLPGPIILSGDGEEFELDYPSAGKSVNLKKALAQISEIIGLELSSTHSPAENCALNQRAALDLASLSEGLKQRFSKYIDATPQMLKPLINP